MAGCLLVTLPLEAVLGARVWRRPGRAVRSLALPFAVFFAWDALAVARGHWSFDPRYVTGWRLPFGVPVEEAVFFVVVPLCGLLTYEAVRRLLPRAAARAGRTAKAGADA